MPPLHQPPQYTYPPPLPCFHRHAGRSRVEYRSTTLALGWHLLHRDFFVTMLQASWLQPAYYAEQACSVVVEQLVSHGQPAAASTLHFVLDSAGRACAVWPGSWNPWRLVALGWLPLEEAVNPQALCCAARIATSPPACYVRPSAQCTTAVTPTQTPFIILASWIAALYLTIYLSFGFLWWLVVRCGVH